MERQRRAKSSSIGLFTTAVIYKEQQQQQKLRIPTSFG